jgi:hypothetical protein
MLFGLSNFLGRFLRQKCLLSENGREFFKGPILIDEFILEFAEAFVVGL